jgi:cell division protein FtsI (penicillin-binding protein 3)
MQNNNANTPEPPKRDRVSWILFVIHGIALLLALFIVVRIIHIQLFYNPVPVIERRIRPVPSKRTLDPIRGDIVAKDGRLLAVSTPLYQIYMDCTVLKQSYSEKGEKGKKEEAEWMAKAQELAKGLSRIYGDKSAKAYYELIATGRREGRKYVKIGHRIDHDTLLKVRELPLFKEGPNKGGIIEEKEDSRMYPFGSLARRTIGYIKDNNSANNHIGLEGKFYDILHGEGGYEWTRVTEHHGRIHNYDSTSVAVKNGKGLITTLDIDIQDIADKALRNKIQDIPEIEGGCVIVMDVKTGGIRAMVNLKRDEAGYLGETYNYAIGTSGDPGSVFKLATLMTLIEDGHTKLSDTIPTFYGQWTYDGVKLPADTYLSKRDYPSGKISVVDGLEISSNHVFRYLACQHYGKNPEKFIERLKDYGLDEKYDFDLVGLATPSVQKPGSASWSKTSLPSIAIGYSVTETPLHMVTFYNAIANGGKLMKPYLVEAITKDGKIHKNLGPEVLKKQICSKATADSLKKALRSVVAEGTGSALRKAKCEVGGKTGTAQIAFEVKSGNKTRVVYVDKDGRKKHQGSFVGFFPVEDPQYTAIVVVYSKLGLRNFYGGSYAAPVLREIVDKVYALDSQWGGTIKKEASMPRMKAKSLEIGIDKLESVPDVKGLGISDAIYSIENCGYRCEYEGFGKVIRQEPKAGSKYAKGQTVRLTLR